MDLRSIVLRCDQRPTSQRVDVRAWIEINGKQYSAPKARAIVVNPSTGLLGQSAAAALVTAIASEVRAWEALLPLWAER